MNVLFVSSGNSKTRPDPIIHNQGASLELEGVRVKYFYIKGKGIIGYLKNVKILKDFIRQNNFNIIHAHYSMSAFVASLAGAKPLIVSLMGSDVKSDKLFKSLIHLFDRLSWSTTIVKSEDMKISLGIKNTQIIANGVDMNKFKPLNQLECKKKLNWNYKKKQILFAASPKRYEKNYPLANKAFSIIRDNKNFELKVLENLPNDDIPLHLNAADLVLLTSLWEGSPNIIKEAMACNRPILSTKVGDVCTLLDNVSGCDVSGFDEHIVAQKIKYLTENFTVSEGREKLKALGLDSKNVALKILKLYEKTII